jgi:hypothetical protein
VLIPVLQCDDERIDCAMITDAAKRVGRRVPDLSESAVERSESRVKSFRAAVPPEGFEPIAASSRVTLARLLQQRFDGTRITRLRRDTHRLPPRISPMHRADQAWDGIGREIS